MAGIVRVLVWLGLLLTAAQTKRKGRGSSQQPVCLEQCEFERDQSCMQISCKKKNKSESLLVELNITSGHNEDLVRACNFTASKVFCYGISPDLNFDVNSGCYWQQNCTLRLPAKPLILKTTPLRIGPRETCSGKKGAFLVVQRARCIRKKGIFDICESRKLSKKRGMIRSHAEFPFMLETNMTCSKKVNIKKDQEMRVTIKIKDLCDTLQIRTKKGLFSIGDPPASTDGTTPLSFTYKKHRFVEFILGGNNESMPCDGFIICYKDKKLKKPGRGDVCDKITKKATIVPNGPKTDSCLKDREKCCCPGTSCKRAFDDMDRALKKLGPKHVHIYRGCG